MKTVTLDPHWSALKKRVHEHTLNESPGSRDPCAAWCRLTLLDLAREKIEKYAPADAIICDVGCAQGTVALSLAERGYRVYANEIRADFIDYARMRFEHGDCTFVPGNFLDQGWSNKFDVVIFTEVIEHLVDHLAFLRALKKSLKPGGLMFLTTPNHAYVRNRLPRYGEVNLDLWRDREFSADGDDHFYLFDRTELRSLLERAGFEVLESGGAISFLEAGQIRTALLWKYLPERMLAYWGKALRSISSLCTTQWMLVRKPLI